AVPAICEMCQPAMLTIPAMILKRQFVENLSLSFAIAECAAHERHEAVLPRDINAKWLHAPQRNRCWIGWRHWHSTPSTRAGESMPPSPFRAPRKTYP